jgi:putative membrane protein
LGGYCEKGIVTTLVVCIDREGTIAAAAGSTGPITGRETVRDLVAEVGLDDPEDSQVNCLLEALRVAKDTEDESVVAVVTGSEAVGERPIAVGDRSGSRGTDADGRSANEASDRTTTDGETPSPDPQLRPVRPDGSEPRNGVGPDRAIARQVDRLISRYQPSGAVVVIDSAADERLVPIVESRVRVDAVDRVVVRQARDIESTYYLLKQFLADEELRQTVLVPFGLALLGFPVLLWFTDRPATALAAIAGITGGFLLYKGLGIDDRLGNAGRQGREALYSGQVSIVTYVVAVGLALVGVFAGAIATSSIAESATGLVAAMGFVFEGVPWFTTAALVASTGRLLDEVIRPGRMRRSSLNLPFVVVAVGLVVRGFMAYFLERAGVIAPITVRSVRVGALTIQGVSLAPGTRLAALITVGVLVSLVGVSIAARAESEGDPEGVLE